MADRLRAIPYIRATPTKEHVLRRTCGKLLRLFRSVCSRSHQTCNTHSPVAPSSRRTAPYFLLHSQLCHYLSKAPDPLLKQSLRGDLNYQDAEIRRLRTLTGPFREPFLDQCPTGPVFARIVCVRSTSSSVIRNQSSFNQRMNPPFSRSQSSNVWIPRDFNVSRRTLNSTRTALSTGPPPTNFFHNGQLCRTIPNLPSLFIHTQPDDTSKLETRSSKPISVHFPIGLTSGRSVHTASFCPRNPHTRVEAINKFLDIDPGQINTHMNLRQDAFIDVATQSSERFQKVFKHQLHPAGNHQYFRSDFQPSIRRAASLRRP